MPPRFWFATFGLGITYRTPPTLGLISQLSFVWSCLVNTLPITKKNKYTVVTEAHMEYTYAAYAPANLLQKANKAPTGVFPPNESAGLSACMADNEIPSAPVFR